jgi:hypothetical protein
MDGCLASGLFDVLASQPALALNNLLCKKAIFGEDKCSRLGGML